MIIVSNRYEIEILNKWGESETYVDFFIFDKQNNELAHCCNWYDGDIEPTETEILEDLYKDADKWFKLPKTSLISERLFLIFSDICQSENDMLYIEDDDQFKYYDINPITYKQLCNEIDKYKLNDYFEARGEEIIVYGGLQCAFNDDREMLISKGKVYLVNNDYLNKNVDLYNKENGGPYDLLILKENDVYVAIDDSYGECFVEEFENLEQATYWLLDNGASAEDVRRMNLPSYIKKFVIDTTLNKEEDKNYEL